MKRLLRVGDESDGVCRLLATLIALALVTVPTFFSHEFHQPYRFPKLLLLRGLGAVVLVALAASWSARRVDLSTSRRWFSLVAVALAWATFSAVLARSHAAAIGTVITLLATAAFFVAAQVCARSLQLPFLYFLFIPALFQTLLVAAQILGFWYPIVDSFERGALLDPLALRVAPLGTLGNRNDVGMFLAAPALAAITLAVTSKRGRRVAAAVAAVMCAGVVASKTVTAMGALVVAVIILALLRARRNTAVAVVTVVALSSAAAMLYPPLRDRAASIAAAARAGNLDAVITNRSAAYLAATSMFIEHPLTGVGPGNFAAAYFEHRLKSFERWPIAARRAQSEDNFSEAHNDHLQLLAEYGLPGYAIALTLLTTYAALSRRRDDGEHDERVTFARAFALPHAALLVLLAVAQFPLQIAATLLTTAVLAGLCIGWERADA